MGVSLFIVAIVFVLMYIFARRHEVKKSKDAFRDLALKAGGEYVTGEDIHKKWKSCWKAVPEEVELSYGCVFGMRGTRPFTLYIKNPLPGMGGFGGFLGSPEFSVIKTAHNAPTMLWVGINQRGTGMGKLTEKIGGYKRVDIPELNIMAKEEDHLKVREIFDVFTIQELVKLLPKFTLTSRIIATIKITPSEIILERPGRIYKNKEYMQSAIDPIIHLAERVEKVFR